MTHIRNEAIRLIATASPIGKSRQQLMATYALQPTIVDRPRRPRIALYSHDTMGIGHMRRNQLIAQTLAQAPSNGQVLMIAGASEASVFASHSGIDSLTLPSLHKNRDGQYSSRHLDLPLSDVIELRRRTILAAMQAFRPDVFIVDKVPRGVHDELNDTLHWLTSSGNTRCILGLRDVLDTPAVVKQEWRSKRCQSAIDEHFQQIWIYGDRQVFDAVKEYSLDSVADKIQFTGYLNQRQRLTPGENETLEKLLAQYSFVPTNQLAACFVGGGQDGFDLASAFCQSVLPESMSTVTVCGPCMPATERQRLRKIVRSDPRKLILDSMVEADSLLHAADRVVAMGGYNTVCSVLSSEKPALIVPRTRPREEQAIRTRRLGELNLVDMLHPDHLSPSAISRWLWKPDPKRPPVGSAVDMDGLARIPHLLNALLQMDTRELFREKVVTCDS